MRTDYRYFILWVTLAMVLSLTASGNASQPTETVTIGIMESWAPMNFVDEYETPRGIGVDYLNAISKRLDFKLTIIPGQWKQIYDDVKEKRLDAIMDITPKPEREPFFNFTKPYISIPHVFVGRNDAPFFKSEEDLNGKTIALERGFYNVRYFQKNYPDVHIHEYDSTEKALDAVARGEADAYAGNRAVAIYMIEKELMTNLRVMGRMAKPPVILTIGVRKDMPEMAAAFDQALASLTQEEIRQIHRKWVGNADEIESGIRLTAEEQAWLKEHPVILVSNEPDYIPFDFVENGEPAGFSIDYLRLIANRAGLKLEFVKDTWGNLIEMGKNKKIDLLHTIFKTNEREPYFLFTSPYKTVTNMIYVREDIRDIRNISDLSKKKILMAKGDVMISILNKMLPKADILYYETYEEVFQELSTGKGDATVIDSAVANYMIRRYTLTNIKGICVVDIPEKEMKGSAYRLAVRNDWHIFRDILEKAMQTVTAEEMDRLYLKWFGSSEIIDKNIFSVALTSEEKAFIANHKPLVFSEVSWDPLSIVDDHEKFQGIISDYLNLITEVSGIRFVYQKSDTWAEVLQKYVDGKIDVVPALAKDDTIGREILFSEPYVTFPLVIVTRNDVSYIRNTSELNGKHVSVGSGYTSFHFLKKNYPNIRLVETDDVKEGLIKVSNGEVFAFVGHLAVAVDQLRKLGMKNLKIAGETEFLFDHRIGVDPKYPEAIAIINKVLASMSEQKHRQIYKKWVDVAYQKGFDYGLLWRILSGVFFILGISLYWNRRLVREINARKKTEQTLQKSEERLRTITGNAPDFIIELDRNGTILFINRITEGFHASEVIGKNFKNWILPEYHAIVDEAIRTVFTQAKVYEYEIQGFGEHREIRWYFSRINPVVIGNEVRSAILIASDITEYKKTRRLLDESKQKYREIVENANSIILRATPDWNITFFNAFAQEFFGYTENEVLGKNVMETIVPKSESTGRDLTRLIQDIEKYRYHENENVRKNGERVWVAWTNKIIRDEHGNIKEILSIGIDITQKKKIENDLQHRLRYEEGLAAFSRTLVETSEKSITEAIEHLLQAADASRVYIFKNFKDPVDGLCMRQMYEACAPGVESEIDNQILQHLPYQNGFKRWESVLSSGNPIVGSVASFPTGERDILEPQNILSILVLPIRVNTGWYGFIGFDDTLQDREWKKEDIQMLGTAAEILGSSIEQSRIRKELLENQQFLKNILEAIQDGIKVVDPDFNILLANPFFEKLHAHKMPIVGKKCYKVFHENQDKPCDFCLFEEVHRTGIPQRREIPGINPYDNDIWLEIFAFPMTNTESNITGIVEYVRDITQSKADRDALKQAKEDAEAANRAKSMFLANMSHEIRTPMNSVLGFISLILEDSTITEKQRKYLTTAYNSSKSLLGLINDILDVSKLESGKMELEKRAFNLHTMMREIIRTFDIAAKEKGLSLELETDKNLPENVIGDSARLRQILINLIGNAIKFTEKGGIRLEVRGDRSGVRDHGTDAASQPSPITSDPLPITFTVRDTGIGIPSERLDKIFEPFTQADGSTSRKFGGTGLGTTISRQLAELMGGKIWVESEVGKGSTFYFTVCVEQTDMIAESEPKALVAPSARCFRILVAEDIEMNIVLAKIRLDQKGHTVIFARNGREAVEAFQRENPDIILMDVHMPEMDGLEATKRIRNLELGIGNEELGIGNKEFRMKNSEIPNSSFPIPHSHIPIIALTASVTTEEQKIFLEAGMDEVFGKPINFEKLFDTMEKLVPPKNLQGLPAESENLRGLFKDLLNSFEEYNPTAVEPFLEQLSQILAPHQIDPMRQEIERFDFDKAREETVKLMQALDLE